MYNRPLPREHRGVIMAAQTCKFMPANGLVGSPPARIIDADCPRSLLNERAGGEFSLRGWLPSQHRPGVVDGSYITFISLVHTARLRPSILQLILSALSL